MSHILTQIVRIILQGVSVNFYPQIGLLGGFYLQGDDHWTIARSRKSKILSMMGYVIDDLSLDRDLLHPAKQWATHI